MPIVEAHETEDPRIARTRAAVGQAVRELFLEEGWDGITHQRVAERSGYARNSVYRHFPDRVALLAHGGRFDDAVHHTTPTGELRTDLINELTCFRTALFDGPVGTIIASITERAERDPSFAETRDRLFAAGADLTRRLVTEGMAAGRFDATVEVDDLVVILCGPLLYARLSGRTPPSDAAIAHLVDAVLTGPTTPGGDTVG
ncbi:MAG: TetR/AcrR family transcriptional regulator [Actinomycetota bacterium]